MNILHYIRPPSPLSPLVKTGTLHGPCFNYPCLLLLNTGKHICDGPLIWLCVPLGPRPNRSVKCLGVGSARKSRAKNSSNRELDSRVGRKHTYTSNFRPEQFSAPITIFVFSQLNQCDVQIKLFFLLSVIAKGSLGLIHMRCYIFLLGCCHARRQFGQASKTGDSKRKEHIFIRVPGLGRLCEDSKKNSGHSQLEASPISAFPKTHFFLQFETISILFGMTVS